MTDDLGEQLTELESGDSVKVTIEGGRYQGTVTEIHRQKGDLINGFMESGGIAIYIEIGAETIRRHDAPENHILIGAEEYVPYDWDVPTANLYDYSENEKKSSIGELTEIEVTNRPGE